MSEDHQLYRAAMSRLPTGVTVRPSHASSDPLVFLDMRFTTVPTERERMDEPHPGTSLTPRSPPAALGHRRRVIAPYRTRYQRWIKMWRAVG